ncbi:uncharacterized protein PFLUO_LOCUS3575 [Penicillium psychrofluorescens]|uniref:uncharacterized protein n=1 Tax=Penicillium psychrofluorescens TaxID=3158075 RepID=UPI003CCE3550
MSTRSRPSPIPSPGRARSSRSVRRSISPRDEPKRSVTRSPVRGRDRSRSRTRSPSRGRTPSRSRTGGRRYRSRSFSRTPSPNPNPPRSSKIVVEKLTKNVTEAHLREIFGSFGDIEYLDLPINRAFMTNRGTAYILYYDPADAEAAIAHMHEAQLDGTSLNVSIVLPRRNFSRSPPPPVANRGSGRSRYGRGSYGGKSSPPPRRHAPPRPTERHDIYRPKSVSRSRSPVPAKAKQPPHRKPPASQAPKPQLQQL